MSHVVYILASRPHGALYTGRTSNLASRLAAHRAGFSTHTAKYNINQLVWFETHDAFASSLLRERRIKRWRRAWKEALIEAENPHWRDLSGEVLLL